MWRFRTISKLNTSYFAIFRQYVLDQILIFNLMGFIDYTRWFCVCINIFLILLFLWIGTGKETSSASECYSCTVHWQSGTSGWLSHTVYVTFFHLSFYHFTCYTCFVIVKYNKVKKKTFTILDDTFWFRGMLWSIGLFSFFSSVRVSSILEIAVRYHLEGGGLTSLLCHNLSTFNSIRIFFP